jgi:hypothetical protein
MSPEASSRAPVTVIDLAAPVKERLFRGETSALAWWLARNGSGSAFHGDDDPNGILDRAQQSIVNRPGAPWLLP